MLLLGENEIKEMGINWDRSIRVIEDAIRCLAQNDYAQPIKPYLRYRDKKNRFIAMPAFVGGDIHMAGIKWIASFPDNIAKGIARAHSVVILNNADTGEPMALITTALVSIIRTAAISGLMIRRLDQVRKLKHVTLGIIGFGPIGQYHLKMCRALLGDRIARVVVYDIRPVDPAVPGGDDRVEVAARWEDAYLDADIVITCTVTQAPYVDKRPKPGSLHLNVSLRDYKTDAYEWFKHSIIVDDWEEVCREKTDIEMMHLEKGLRREDTRSLVDVLHNNCLADYGPGVPILFNPMGMAVFDVAIGTYYYKEAVCEVGR